MRDGIPPDITSILGEVAKGDVASWERVLPLVYEKLREIAGRQFRAEHRQLTLQPTALVHEAYLRLSERDVAWTSRAHFLAVASSVMRRILVDHARARLADKRGGDWCRTTLRTTPGDDASDELDLLDLEQALTELGDVNPRQARIVQLRFFGGLTVSEVSEALAVSGTTFEADWRVARAWLRRRIHG